METLNQVSVIENSIDILRTAPEILQVNQRRRDKAISVGRNILSVIEETGMNPEVDTRAMNYLANINKAKKEMTESRSGVTQIMDQLKKMYTEVEAVLDIKKEGSVPYKIQKHRDEYARLQTEEADRKRKETDLQAAKANEAIDIRTGFINSMTRVFNDYLLQKKQKFQQKFNELNLENFADDAAAMRQYEPGFSKDHFASLSVTRPSGLYNSEQEKLAICDALKPDLYNQFASIYVEQMTLFKNDLLDKLKSKFEELKEQKRLADEVAKVAEAARIAEEERKKKIAAANAAERKRLEEEAAKAREDEAKRQEELRLQQQAAEAERKRREAEETERMQREAEEARYKAEQAAEIKRQGEQTMILFEQEAVMAETMQAPEVRTGYEIEILHPVAYTQIFALWFENEGKKLSIDKIGNTKLDQMKAWAEKHAHKNNVKIESKFLDYKESIKAINRKVK